MPSRRFLRLNKIQLAFEAILVFAVKEVAEELAPFRLKYAF
jgi:hypothetical protein